MNSSYGSTFQCLNTAIVIFSLLAHTVNSLTQAPTCFSACFMHADLQLPSPWQCMGAEEATLDEMSSLP